MTDDLERRMREADPTRSAGYIPASPSWISDLVEETMNDTEKTPARSRWQIPAVAAGVLVLGIGGYAIAQHNDSGPGTQPTVASRPMRLHETFSSGPAPQLCIHTTVSTLRQKPVAFSGTVTSVTNRSATVKVDHWYRGGSSSSVLIALPKASDMQIPGTPHWTKGVRYLVTATKGEVDGCGYTMPWTAHYARLFDKAFS